MRNDACPYCGTPLSSSWKKDGPRHVCPQCGTICYFEDETIQKATAAELRSVYYALDHLEFADALKTLSSLRENFPDDSRLIFLSALAENRVCYTVDSRSDKRIPTLNDLPEEDISAHPLARLAIEKAESPAVAENYRDCFAYLDAKRAEILEAEGRYSYDVFISVKVNQVDEHGQLLLDAKGNPIPTEDFKVAFETYRFLRENFPDLRVFFSESQEAKLLMAGNRYENIIYAALHSAKLFLLVADSPENLVWRWVRNEWKRYLFSLEHEKGKGDRRLVLLTSKLKERDLPAELRGNQFIDASVAFSSTKVLEGLVKDVCYKIHRIAAKSFDQEGQKPVVAVKPVETVTKELKRYEAVSSRSLQTTLERLRLDLNPAYPEIREEAFIELEHLLQENPDLYPARKMLLLKGTDLAAFEEYVSSPKLILDKPQIMKEFLDFASVEDGSAALTTLANTLADPACLSHYGPKVYIPLLKDQILPYRESVSRDALERLVAMAHNNAAENFTIQKCFPFCKLIIALWDYLEPEKYVDHRLSYHQIFKGLAYPGGNPSIENKLLIEAREFCRAILDEALSAEPEDYTIAYEALQFGFEPKKPYLDAVGDLIYASKLFERAALDARKLRLILTLLRNGKEADRQLLLCAFLFSLTQDDRLTGKKDGADEELSPYALFLRYIGYPLPEAFPIKESHLKIDANTSIDPSPEAYRYKDKPSAVDGLLSIFGYELHKRERYAEAKEIYGYYLGEQGKDAIGPDACLVRCYIALCNCGDPSFSALSPEKDLLDHRTLGDDLIAAAETYPEVKNLYDKTRAAYVAHRRSHEANGRIRPLLEEFESLRTWDSLARSKELKEEIQALIDGDPEGFKAYLARFQDLCKDLDEAEANETLISSFEKRAEHRSTENLSVDLRRLNTADLPNGGVVTDLWLDLLKEGPALRDLEERCDAMRFRTEEGRQKAKARIRAILELMNADYAIVDQAKRIVDGKAIRAHRVANVLKYIGIVLGFLFFGGLLLSYAGTPLLYFLPESIRENVCMSLSFAFPFVLVGCVLICHFREIDLDISEPPESFFDVPVFLIPCVMPFAGIALSISDYFFMADGPFRIASMVAVYGGVLLAALLGIERTSFWDPQWNRVARSFNFFVAALAGFVPMLRAVPILYGAWSRNAFEFGFLTGYPELPLWVMICAPLGFAITAALFMAWWMLDESDEHDINIMEDMGLGVTGIVALWTFVPFVLVGFFGSFVLFFGACAGAGPWSTVGWSFLYGTLQLLGAGALGGAVGTAYYFLTEDLG